MASDGPVAAAGTKYCPQCGKQIEAEARFCRFCGRSQSETSAPGIGQSRPASRPPGPASTSSRSPRTGSATADGLEIRLRQLFPRARFQDDFTHVGSVAAFFMALIGFVLGFFRDFSWLSISFLLGAIALLLFLLLREWTLSQVRASGGSGLSTGLPGRPGGVGRPAEPSANAPAEAATTQSSPSAASQTPRPPARQ